MTAAAAMFALGGCVPDDGTLAIEPAPEMGQRFGLLEIRANAGRGSGGVEQRVDTAVHFVEHRGVSREAVTTALDAWTPPASMGCMVLDPPSPAVADASLDLLNAGSVGVSGNGGATRLTPRFLGGGPNLSGFAYGGGQDDAPIWAAGEIYTVWASGDEVGPFAFGIPAPDRIQFIEVSGREVGSAHELSVDANEDIDIRFFSDARDVYVSVRTLEPYAEARVECHFEAIDGVAFDAAELQTTFGGQDLEFTLRTATVVPLPESAELQGDAIAQVYDRLVIRR